MGAQPTPWNIALSLAETAVVAAGVAEVVPIGEEKGVKGLFLMIPGQMNKKAAKVTIPADKK
ncbi:MAG: hypothetical protein U0903_14490 [Planctomycetales bacterium]